MPTSKPFRPFARAVINAQHLQAIVPNSIGNDIGRLRHHEFARAGHASGAAHVRLAGKQLFDVANDVEHDPLRRRRVILRDIGT